jgi:hypothetical protein
MSAITAGHTGSYGVRRPPHACESESTAGAGAARLPRCLTASVTPSRIRIDWQPEPQAANQPQQPFQLRPSPPN